MQKTYGQNFDISRPGFIAGMGMPRTKPYRNAANSLGDVFTIAIPTSPDANASYKISWGAIVAEALTDATPTQAELSASLLTAVRNSDIYGPWVPSLTGNVLTLKSRALGIPQTLTVNTNTTADLVLTQTVIAANPSPIPFGLFVARKAGDEAGDARLVSAVTDKLLGVTLSTYAIERDSIGPDAGVAYQPNEMMDVVDNCNTLDGIWVQTVDLNITIDDAVYVVPTGVNAGKATRSSGGTITVPAARFETGSTVLLDGTPMVRVWYPYI